MKTFEPWETELVSDYKDGKSHDDLIFKYQYKLGMHKHGYLVILVEDIVRQWMIQCPRVEDQPLQDQIDTLRDHVECLHRVAINAFNT